MTNQFRRRASEAQYKTRSRLFSISPNNVRHPAEPRCTSYFGIAIIVHWCSSQRCCRSAGAHAAIVDRLSIPLVVVVRPSPALYVLGDSL
jgi:hypothetical protein